MIIKPFFWADNSGLYSAWNEACEKAEMIYLELLRTGCSPQQARSVLPNSLKTEIVATANLREWRHILRLRTSYAAHPQMRELMFPLLNAVKVLAEPMFDDIEAGS